MKRVKDKAMPFLRRIRHSRGESHWRALGAVDLHFHGAFGIDLMRAGVPELDRLAAGLHARGVSAFLPTTLSAGLRETEAAISRLGPWIRSKQDEGPTSRASFPLGIHLEGPFLSRSCCGAHPERHLIRPSLRLLKRWQRLSRGTIAKVTLAPETASWGEIRRILDWAKQEKIAISLGHSHADPVRTRQALDRGASSLTHAWNAMPFHHRSPGMLGESLGRDDLFIEIIPDNIHVSDVVVDWTMKIHPRGVCLVSDAVPAAHSRGWVPFGPLQVRIAKGAGRTREGTLAGGGCSLFEMAASYWSRQPGPRQDAALARRLLESITVWPLLSLPGARSWIPDLNRCQIREYRFGRRLSLHSPPGPG